MPVSNGIELIQGSDVLNTGRIKINNFFSGQTNLWSSGTGSDSVFANNYSNNLATGLKATVLGGAGNQALNSFASVVNGSGNTAYGAYSIVGGGSGNTATASFSVIGGGRGNRASGTLSFIGGGVFNTASTSYATIGGGKSNRADGGFCVTIGGLSNSALTIYSSVVGGKNNLGKGRNCFIGGGLSNTAATDYCTVVGGRSNQASGINTFIGGGRGNSATTSYSSVVGGRYNLVTGQRSAIAGGGGIFISTKLSNEVNGNNSFIGAGSVNVISSAGGYSAIGAGGGYGTGNIIAATASFIGAGTSNKISGVTSFIGAGNQNSATTSSSNAGIAAGYLNVVSEKDCFIGGGMSNRASGYYSTVPAGIGNHAAHLASAAFGGGSKTRNNFDIAIGGTLTTSASVTNNTIMLSGSTGSIVYEGQLIAGTADYAEMFEFEDGNPSSEDRVGYFVSLESGKIKIGNKSVIGIISANPAVIGDSGELHWSDMYETDEWGRKIFDKYTIYKYSNDDKKNNIVFVNSEGKKYTEYPNPSFPKGVAFEGVIPEDSRKTQGSYAKINSNFDSSVEYKPRSQRKEWGMVGLLGKLYVRAAENIISDFVDVDENGRAINGTKYHVLKTVKQFNGSEGIIQVFIK